MLRPRIIPCLLIRDKGLIKTQQFKSSRYLGDPINAVRIFNEKQVDELMVLDIDASKQNKEPDYKMIDKMASECRMPLCYGGGIQTVEQAQRIFSLGVEKISLSSVAIRKPELIPDIVEKVGSQSVVVTLDVKKKIFGGYDVWIHNGTINTKISPETWVKKFEELGVGEIVINSIDKDGMMKGYDYQLTDKIFKATHVPVTFLGGAGSLADIEEVVKRYGSIGVAAGSIFVFKGNYKAVLINYPTSEEKNEINYLSPLEA
ncbi:imidazole glycerol phosphate synthase subunit HisF [Taibaiella lutea]|uniref:imidazole glycerol-phosphate synthase n=1 Tax=Taibaiella lutea TaxID=2608001 RepID=A0A5M6CF12_9BACT|nr:AglZ/HisF2 family acetamidino modification protein [Taibaiella lutea]KAA5533788.1 imidazole glycerol phosphate synthase subunit HisF [Taibaiella lutea]